MQKITNFAIYISNCLFGGNAFLEAKKQVESSIIAEFSKMKGLKFTGINSNVVRGDHNSFSLIVRGVIYDYKGLSLEILVKLALSRISDLFFSEIRIEQTRSWHTISEAASIIRELYGVGS